MIEEAKKVPLGNVYSSQLLARETEIRDLKKKSATSGGRTWVHQSNPNEHAEVGVRAA